jgi:hypothetical protein
MYECNECMFLLYLSNLLFAESGNAAASELPVTKHHKAPAEKHSQADESESMSTWPLY